MNITKPDCRSSIFKLTPEGRETLDRWLFEENLGYREIERRSLETLGARIRYRTLVRYYRVRLRARTLERIAHSAQCANAVMKKFEDHPTDTFRLLLKMAGQIAFEKAIDAENGFDTKTIAEFIKILISARKVDLESEKFKLERDKWEFDAARACHQHQAEIQAVIQDDYLDEDAQVLAIRRHLFGTNLPT
jgi:Protein of unknown function (DUF3486)